jgi:hypothetical protein
VALGLVVVEALVVALGVGFSTAAAAAAEE